MSDLPGLFHSGLLSRQADEEIEGYSYWHILNLTLFPVLICYSIESYQFVWLLSFHTQCPFTYMFSHFVISYQWIITFSKSCRSLLLSQLLSADWFPSELFFCSSISIKALLQNLILLYSKQEQRDALSSEDTSCVTVSSQSPSAAGRVLWGTARNCET